MIVLAVELFELVIKPMAVSGFEAMRTCPERNHSLDSEDRRRKTADTSACGSAVLQGRRISDETACGSDWSC
ncbi:MAG: hypothetical protein GXY44_16860 [Phycisphaerales bacterium]|nr:hypothetical protein [Phycisphaerales bacterium]